MAVTRFVAPGPLDASRLAEASLTCSEAAGHSAGGLTGAGAPRGLAARLEAGSYQAVLARAVATGQQGLAHRGQRLQRAAHGATARQHDRLDGATARLQALDPSRVLARGYAWVENEQGRAVVSSRSLTPGQPLRAVWADGAVRARVTEVEPASEPDHP